ncbi:MAG: signal peptidase I [Candidatus Nanoarchaeia archaeon]|nr:signal peptidase I [Candidatus Nanoarchaeia archaeon]
MELKQTLRKVWYFLWKDNSIWSWLVNLIIAFIIVKFVIYPVLGLIFGTGLPIVAVVSCSMEHSEIKGDCALTHQGFDVWWDKNKEWYLDKGITKEQFSDFIFKNGFNKGDIIFIFRAKNLKVGDVIVYQTSMVYYPIIHRVVHVDPYITKGDNNQVNDPKEVSESQIIGKAVFKIPLLGWIKIWFVNIIQFIGGLF